MSGVSVAGKLKNINTIPVDVFPKDIAESMKLLSDQTNIPLEFICTAALFAVASQAGNQYYGNLNGRIKPIIYAANIGPSGVGKTPAYNKLCGDIINPLRKILDDEYKTVYAAYKDRLKTAKEFKQQFTERPPVKKIRIIEDGTDEAISKHAETSPGGFGLYYDEGGRFFGSSSQYKRDNSSVHTFNEIWNGKSHQIIRVDQEKDRFIPNPAISVLIGLQADRMAKYFTEDVLQSGLAYRFLMCKAAFKPINETVDYFDDNVKEMCETWKNLIRSLFYRGARLEENFEPICVEFNQEAKLKYNEVMGEIAAQQNVFIRSVKKEDDNITIIGAAAKLQAYVARLALILAIIDDHTGPTITAQNIEGAYVLYKYYKRNSDKILLSLSGTATTGLTDNEAELLENLPDNQFTTKEAGDVCETLNLNKKFFLTSMRRKYKAGWIKTVSKGVYEKI